MSEMVERVAKKLQEGDDAFSPGSSIDPWYRGAAMAAIEEMLEPTDDVAEIMNRHASNGMVDWRDLHKAFIEAILK